MKTAQRIERNIEATSGIIILAAGNSSRFGGSIKQLLIWHGKTLLQHTIDEAFKARLHPVIVVTGAYEPAIYKKLHADNILLVHNEDWQMGMGNSISTGVKKIMDLESEIHSIIISVCDQPFISASIFLQLIQKANLEKKGIIASAYAGTLGTPVLFHQKYFGELQTLGGHEGAKKLLKIFSEDVAFINFPKGNIDIDTQEAYVKLLGSEY